MRKHLIAGAAILALFMNSPQVSAADEDVVIFGEEFDDDADTKPREVERPEPIREVPPPVERPVEKPEPVNEPEPVQEPAPVNEPEPVQESDETDEADDDLGDVLIFDDTSSERNQPVEKPMPAPVDKPFTNQTPEPVNEPEPVAEPEPVKEPEPRRTQRTNRTQPTEPSNQKLKQLKKRFVKLLVDETYIYYLDRNYIKWCKMPYSTSEYMADFWVRMVAREPQGDEDFYGDADDSIEILSARENGYRYRPEDEEVLRHQHYVLGHYYLRPKTKQLQFLCELEVFGRPQNTINEREYDYRNWENLVPGSVEAAIYASVVKLLDTSKADPKGHMTVSDMLDEYLRISL